MSETSKADHSLKQRSKADQVFIVLIIIFLSALIWMLSQVQGAIINMQLLWKEQCDAAQKGGFEWPALSEFRITIMAAFACYLLRVVSDFFIHPYFYKLFQFEEVDKVRIVKS
jgi:hypothetical protein